MDKSLAVCIPAAPNDDIQPGRIDNLSRTIDSFATASKPQDWTFELTVCVDGIPCPALYDMLATKQVQWSFLERMEPQQASDKNRARNFAVGMSRSNFVLCLDQDLLIDEMFFDSITAAMNDTGDDRTLWFPMDRDLESTPSSLDHENLLKCSKPWDYDKTSHVTGATEPYLDASYTKYEGQPICSRRLFHLLGGMDPRFRGWGGNKEDFTNRAKQLGLRFYIVGTAFVYHQPHGRRNTDEASFGGTALFHMLKNSREQAAPPEGWLRRKQLVHGTSAIAPIQLARPTRRKHRRHVLS